MDQHPSNPLHPKSARTSLGRFVKGHQGFKPKGSVSREKKRREQQLDWLLDQLEKSMVETLPLLTPNQRVKYWLKLISLFVPKLKRVPYEPEPKEMQVPEFVFVYPDDQFPNSSVTPQSS
jgi:hypothetical protein